jgi:molybdenum cofactor cytidylyltransferase
MNTPVNIVGILLAAGNSHRFGSNKLLHPINDQAMLSITAKKLKSSLPDSIAIIKPGDRELKYLLRNEGMTVIECEHANNGMGASLACGIKSSMGAGAWLIALADMPFIHSTTINKVVHAMDAGASIAVPEYSGRRGHPVGFSQEYKHLLAALDSDQGARDILIDHQPQITPVIVDDPGIGTDIDTPEDINDKPFS